MKFCDSDEALLCKTILIGMPAVGKSALTNYLQDGFEKSTGRKIPVISTDEEIDKIGKNPENKLLRDFMASHGMTADDVPIVPFRVIEKYGENVFRDFESAVIIDLLNKGELNGKMVNLGGKAALHPATSKALKDAGYNCIYLKADSKILLPHVMKDYRSWLSGQNITRTNINIPIKNASDAAASRYVSEIKDGKYFSNGDYKSVLKKTRRLMKKSRKEMQFSQTLTARTLIARMLYERDGKYASASSQTIEVSGDLGTDARKIINAVRQTAHPQTLHAAAFKNARQSR